MQYVTLRGPRVVPGRWKVNVRYKVMYHMYFRNQRGTNVEFRSRVEYTEHYPSRDEVVYLLQNSSTTHKASKGGMLK